MHTYVSFVNLGWGCCLLPSCCFCHNLSSNAAAHYICSTLLGACERPRCNSAYACVCVCVCARLCLGMCATLYVCVCVCLYQKVNDINGGWLAAQSLSLLPLTPTSLPTSTAAAIAACLLFACILLWPRSLSGFRFSCLPAYSFRLSMRAPKCMQSFFFHHTHTYTQPDAHPRTHLEALWQPL